jgi:hypothetical protein
MFRIQTLKSVVVNSRRGFASKTPGIDEKFKQLQTQFPKLKLSQKGTEIQCQVGNKKQTLTYGDGKVDLCLAYNCNGAVHFDKIEPTLLSKGYLHKYVIVLPDLSVILAESRAAAYNYVVSRVDMARCFIEQIGGFRSDFNDLGPIV